MTKLKYKLILWLSLIWSMSGLSQDYARALERADSLITAQMEEQKIPGLAITVIRDGQVLMNRGYGIANKELGTKVDPDSTLFRIASISKPMTSALLARLQMAGQFHPDSTVQHYCTWFPEKEHRITAREVGGHTAGIRSYKGQEWLSNVHYNSVKDAIKIFQDDPLEFAPGEKYFYSSYGWNLMSAVAEDAGEGEYLLMMQDSVCGPMGLHHTFANDKTDHTWDAFRTGYYKKLKNGEIVDEPEVDVSNKWAGGGLESSSHDVAQFADEFWFGEHIDTAIRDDYVAPRNLNNGKTTEYGMGWISREDDYGRYWYGHAGGGVGATAMMIVYPEDKLVIGMLSNMSGAKIHRMYFPISDYILSSP